MQPLRQRILIAVVFTVVSFGLLQTSSWNHSPTFDEPEHVAAGYCFVTTGESFMNPLHPPLVKDLSGLSLWLLVRPPQPEHFAKRHPLPATYELFDGEPHPQRIIRAARLPMVALSALFVGFFCLALGQRFGNGAAFAGGAMLAISPTFLGHGPLVHTDVAAAATAFLALWLLASYLKTAETKSMLLFAVACGLANLVKFSMLVIYPVYLLSIALAERQHRVRLLKQVPVVLLVGLAVVWLVYALHPVPQHYQEMYNQTFFQQRTDLFARAIEEGGRVAPLRPLAWYGAGVYRQLRHLEQGHDRPGFFVGNPYTGGDWRYFPVLLLTKLPLGFLALGLLALPGLRTGLDVELKLYLLFAGVYLVVAMVGNLNLGVRHLLPMFGPGFAVVAAGLARGVEQVQAVWFKALVGVAFLCAVLSVARAWPHYLSYYNLATGQRLVALDSNLDWGQDLFRLSRLAEQREWEVMYYALHTRVRPQAYLGGRAVELTHDLPDSGRVVISMNYYPLWKAWSQRPLPEDADEGTRHHWKWVGRLQEQERVGHSLMIATVKE